MKPDVVSGRLQIPDGKKRHCWRCSHPVQELEDRPTLHICQQCGQLWTISRTLVGDYYHVRLEWKDDVAEAIKVVIHQKEERKWCEMCQKYEKIKQRDKLHTHSQWIKQNWKEPTGDMVDIFI